MNLPFQHLCFHSHCISLPCVYCIAGILSALWKALVVPPLLFKTPCQTTLLLLHLWLEKSPPENIMLSKFQFWNDIFEFANQTVLKTRKNK